MEDKDKDKEEYKPTGNEAGRDFGWFAWTVAIALYVFMMHKYNSR